MGCTDALNEQASEVEAHLYEVDGRKLWRTRQYRVSAMWINGSDLVNPSQVPWKLRRPFGSVMFAMGGVLH